MGENTASHAKWGTGGDGWLKLGGLAPWPLGEW